MGFEEKNVGQGMQSTAALIRMMQKVTVILDYLESCMKSCFLMRPRDSFHKYRLSEQYLERKFRKMNLNMTEKEQMIVKQLKTKVGLVLAAKYDDQHFLRWVREYNCNLPQAEAAFRKVQEFRKRVGADGEFDSYCPPQVLRKYYAGGILGHDKEGAVVKLELLGKLDMKGLMRSTRRTDLERWKSFEYDRMDRMLDEFGQKAGKPVDGITTIIDMEGVGSEWLWRPGLNTYLSLANLLQEHYPGIVKKLIVINAPSIFPLLWKISKGFLREDLRRRVEVFGADYKELLKKEINESVLPVYLGGTLKDPDERCSAQVCQGGKVPESFYMSPDGEELDHMSVAHVAHGEKLRLQYGVTELGCILSWQFKTDDNDIGFGVEYRPTEDSDDIEDIVPLGRHESHLQIQDGNIVCDKTGVYEVIFDNTYSWTRGKRLFYHVELHMNDVSTKTEVDGFIPGEAGWDEVAQVGKK